MATVKNKNGIDFTQILKDIDGNATDWKEGNKTQSMNLYHITRAALSNPDPRQSLNIDQRIKRAGLVKKIKDNIKAVPLTVEEVMLIKQSINEVLFNNEIIMYAINLLPE